VLDNNAVRDSDDVTGDPGARPCVVGETAVQQDVVAVGRSHVVFVAHLGRRRFYEIEEAIPSRRDMCAVLDVVR